MLRVWNTRLEDAKSIPIRHKPFNIYLNLFLSLSTNHDGVVGRGRSGESLFITERE